MSDSNIVWIDFGKKDDFFDEDRPIHQLTISWQMPAWLYRLLRREKR